MLPVGATKEKEQEQEGGEGGGLLNPHFLLPPCPVLRIVANSYISSSKRVKSYASGTVHDSSFLH
jgi:hypothetical protein